MPGSPLRLRQRVRRFARDLVVDRLGGHLGLRVIRVPGRSRHRRAIVLAETVDCLLDTASVRPSQLVEARQFTVLVAWWVAPKRGWTSPARPLPGVARHRVRLPRRGRGMVRVHLWLDHPVPVAEAVAAALTIFRPHAPTPLHPEAAGAQAGVSVGSGPRVLVDLERINPRGRRPESYRADAPTFRLHVDGAEARLTDGLYVDGAEARLTDGSAGNGAPWGWRGQPAWRHLTGDLGWRTVTALRSVGVIECGQLSGVEPTAAASAVVQLAMTGVVLQATDIASSVAHLLAPELRAILAEPLPAPVPAPLPAADAGTLDQEVRSVRQRRAALRGHSVQFGGNGRPAVSAILTTRRTEYLPGILRAIAEQTYPNLEIILCLHGIGLPEECSDYLAHCGRPVEVVPVSAELTFGIALSLATRRASGALVTKFDDDDAYGPEHVWDLVLARAYSGAMLVGKGIEFVHLQDANVTLRRRSGQPEAYTDVVAGGTILIGRAELEQLGGWQPVSHSEDQALLDRVDRAGATVYRTHPLGYLYHRRRSGHTWAADDNFFLRTAYQRWPGLPALPELTTATAFLPSAPTASI